MVNIYYIFLLNTFKYTCMVVTYKLNGRMITRYLPINTKQQRKTKKDLILNNTKYRYMHMEHIIQLVDVNISNISF